MEWAPNILRLIQQMKVPVIPIYFHGHNSVFFNFLGLISWKLRSLRLPGEVYRSKGRTLRVSIGEVIPVEKQLEYKTPEELGVYLRDQTYKAGKPFR